MPSLWHQSAFGKFVDPATDCIVPGVEYARTGVGRAFPPGAQSACSPRAIGVSDHIDWTSYPWKRQQAQFTLRPVLGTDGVWYLQGARLFVRREQRDTGGRYFHHTAYAVIPLDALADDRDLFALPEALVAAPLPVKTDLDALPVYGRDVPLAPGWFEEDFRLMLGAVLAGVGAAVQGRDSADEFVFTALRCAACLPRAVRWRLTLGAAFPETPEGFALAHGVNANGKVRRAAGGWRGADSPQLAAVAEQVRQIEYAVASARSTGELLRLSDAFWGPELQHRCPPGLPAELGWADAVGALRERDLRTALRAYLAGHSATPIDLGAFRYERAGVLAESLTAVAADRIPASLLGPCWGPDWAPVWMEVANGHPLASPGAAAAARTLARLRGSAPFDPSGFDLRGAALLPIAETDGAADRIARAFASAAPADRTVWGPLIAAAGHEPVPPVLRAWVAARPGEVLWTGIDLETRSEPIRCVSGWSVPGSELRAYLALQRGEAPDRNDFALLRQNVPPTHTDIAQRLGKRAEAAGLIAEAALLGVPARTREALAPAERASTADQLAAGLIRYGLASALVMPLLDLWDELRPEREEALAPVLGPAIYPEFHRALFGDRYVPPSQSGRRFEAPHFRTAIDRLTGRSEKHSRRVRPAVTVVRSADPIPVATPVFDPADEAVAEQFIRDLDSYKCLKLPDLTAAQARAAARRVDDPSRNGTLPAAPSGITTPGQLRAAAAVAGSYFRPDWERARAERFLPALLADPDPEFWQRAARAARMTDFPVFRFLTGSPLDHPRGAEERELLALPDGPFVQVVSRFGKLTAPLLGRVLARLGSGAVFDIPFLRALAQHRSKSLVELVTDAIFRNLIGRLTPGEREEVREALRGARGYIFTGRAVGNGDLQQLVLDILQNRTGRTESATEWTRWLNGLTEEPCPPGVLFELPKS